MHGENLASSLAQDSGLRLDLCPHANVTLIADAEHEFTGRLADISQSALRMIVGEPLPLNELACVELSDHLVLADLKNCEARGENFTLDAVRLVTLPKASTLSGADKKAKIEALLADFHLQCQLQVSTLQASMAALDARAAQDPGLDTTEKESVRQSEARKEPDAAKSNPLPANQIKFTFTNSLRASSARIDPVVAHPKGPSKIVATGASSQAPIPEATTVIADPAKPKSFAEHMTLLGVAPPQRKTRRGRIALSLIAVAAILGGVAWIYRSQPESLVAAVFGEKRLIQNVPKSPASPLAAVEDDEQDRADVSSRKPEIDTSATPQQMIPSKPAASPTPHIFAPPLPSPSAVDQKVDTSNSLLHASLKATSPSWIAVCYDGKERFQHLLAAGATEEIIFTKAALVRLGNAPAVGISFEGKPIESKELPGVLRTVEFGAEGARFINYRGASKACGDATDVVNSSGPTGGTH